LFLLEEIAIFRKNICATSTQDKALSIRVNIVYFAPVGFISQIEGQIFSKLVLFLLTAVEETLYLQEWKYLRV
jgi:hypothetical protein